MGQHFQIPNHWMPRVHQTKLWNYITENREVEGKRAAIVWHRRAGKDSVSLNLTATEMFQRVGVYWHMLPTTVQARKVIWNGIDRDGRRIIDQAFPKELRKRTNNQEMLIELCNGAMWQLCGSDNYDSLVGSNPVGVIFSEYSIANPAAWDYIRPILAENGGWAIFIYTPRGKNHGHKLYKMAQKNPKWLGELLTVEHSFREDGTRVVPDWAVEEERNAGMAEEKVLQEFYCSFEAGMEGALYTKELSYADEHKLNGSFPWDPERPCITVWDLGIRDDTVVGIFQQHSNNQFPVLIDCVTGRNRSMFSYIKEVQEKPYNYSGHFAPHDIEQREYATGKTRRELAEEVNFWFEVVPKLGIEDGMEACRAFIKKCYMNTDNEDVERVKDGLASYRREWDEKKKLWGDKPYHDWASHFADMMRYAAITFNNQIFSTVGNIFKTKRSHRARGR